MAYNFKNCDWDQLFLFPPDIRDWLPQDHLVWFITEIVSQLDLEPFYSRYNPEGDGRPAYHPAMMTALYFYSYCSGERSSRRIERLCMESVPYRVVSGGLQPDHTTISRFRKKFASELSALFLQIITLCRKAGLCTLNTVSLDGTKIGANASLSANRNEAGLRKEIRNYFREADDADAREDELYGPGRRGDELPPDLTTREGRLRKLREIQKSLREEKEEKVREQEKKIEDRIVQEESTGKKKRGRKPKSVETVKEKASEMLKVNITDPESRIMKTAKGHLQGYNAQAAASEDRIILSAEVTQDCNDKKQLLPMLKRTKENLAAADRTLRMGTLLADAGYFSRKNLELADSAGPELLVAVSSEWKTMGRRTGGGAPSSSPQSPAQDMEEKLRSPGGKELYRKRGITIEPIFGHIKEVLGFRRFMRRGLEACGNEWKLMCMAHNLLKLWRYGIDKVHKTADALVMVEERERAMAFTA